MKLIHLPTGEVENHSLHIADALLAHKNSQYIRAELPQYWRVEGYENSWEWFGCPVHLGFVGIDKQGEHWASNDFHQDYPQISRAEFEYHIYNPWKAQKETDFPLSIGLDAQQKKEKIEEVNQQFERIGYGKIIDFKLYDKKLTDNELVEITRQTKMPWAVDPTDGIIKPVSSFSEPFSPSPLYKHMAENHNVTLLGSEENDIKQIVLNDLDTLKQQAEKMGYELVKKTKKPLEFECDWNKYLIYTDAVTISDKEDGHTVEVINDDFDTLIEKYKQFKTNNP
jgi:hypothetical protein